MDEGLESLLSLISIYSFVLQNQMGSSDNVFSYRSIKRKANSFSELSFSFTTAICVHCRNLTKCEYILVNEQIMCSKQI